MLPVARFFDLRPVAVEQICGGFSGAVIYRVTTSDARHFAIRQVPLAKAIDTERQLELNRLMKALVNQGIEYLPFQLVPRPSFGRDFHVFDSFVETATDRWHAEPWMPGSAADGAEVTQARIEATCNALREVHQAARAYVDAGHRSEWFTVGMSQSNAVSRRLQLAEELANGELTQLNSIASSDIDDRIREAASRVIVKLRRWLPELIARLRSIRGRPVRVQPVLRDVWKEHVLFTDSRVTGLIDLTAVASDNPAIDIARLFRSWFGSDNDRIRHAVQMAIRAGVIQPDERALFYVIDTANVLLNPVTWLRRRLQLPSECVWTPAMTDRVGVLSEIARTFQPMWSDHCV